MSTVVLSSIAPRSTVVAQTAPAPRTHLRITRRGRAVLTTLAALPIVVGAFLVALNGGVAAAGNDSRGTNFDYITVQSGQSLWELAEKVAPAADPRDVISDIVRLNQLQSTDIQPGQKIAIPTQYDGAAN